MQKTVWEVERPCGRTYTAPGCQKKAESPGVHDVASPPLSQTRGTCGVCAWADCNHKRSTRNDGHRRCGFRTPPQSSLERLKPNTGRLVAAPGKTAILESFPV